MQISNAFYSICGLSRHEAQLRELRFMAQRQIAELERQVGRAGAGADPSAEVIGESYGLGPVRHGMVWLTMVKMANDA